MKRPFCRTSAFSLTYTRLHEIHIRAIIVMTEVIINQYYKNLTAIEFGTISSPPDNFLIFIGGLGDGFLTVPYIKDIAAGLLQIEGSKWNLVQALISSSYQGYGTGSLQRDTKELSKLVGFLRSKRGNKSSKVILMGHSTGCQDTIEYLSKLVRTSNFNALEALDGGILQAPVSDSESILENEKATEYLRLAQDYIDQGKPNEYLPLEVLRVFFGAPFSAYRFKSLVAKNGDDDYFSSYLTDEDYQNSFGKIEVPILVLYSGADEFVPDSVNKQALIDKWKSNTKEGVWSQYSCVIGGATHNVGPKSKSGAVEDLVARVMAFIKSYD